MKIKIAIALIVFLCLGTVYFLGWNRENPGLATDGGDLFLLSESRAVTESLPDETESIMSFGENEEEKTLIYVYVCGYVNSPGVYELYEGARMYEAVELAGGANEQGCIQYLEMAGFLYDGQRIYVPSWEEAKEVTRDNLSHEATDNGLVNINTADKSKLMELPGIGEAKADAIIKYRSEVGKFTQIEDIMNISGIKEAAFAKIKEYICAY